MDIIYETLYYDILKVCTYLRFKTESNRIESKAHIAIKTESTNEAIIFKQVPINSTHIGTIE